MPHFNTYADNMNLRHLPYYVRSYSTTFLQPATDYPNGTINHLIFALEGKGYAEICGVKKELNPGDFFFYRADTPVKYYPKYENEDFITRFITFDGYGCTPLFDYYNVPLYIFFKSKIVDSLLYDLCLFADQGGKIEQISARLYNLLIEMFNQVAETSTPQGFARAVLYIRTNYYKDLSIKDIAEYAGISESALYKQFKKVQNTTPVAYTTAKRMQWVKYFLANNPFMSIDEISTRVGFNSPSYFAECFKALEGKTPIAFRKKNIKKIP